MTRLLVVAGEASGDRAASLVVAALRAEGADVQTFGMGGAALESEGTALLADLRASTALGVGEVAGRAASVALAHARVLRAARHQRPTAALLVNYSEFNQHLAARLHAERIRVLWYIAPQVWAWRAGRVAALRPLIDRMAVVLPFEEPLWRAAGVDAHYVGHPACEAPRLDHKAARELLGLTPYAPAVAILPGSRPHEVDTLLPPMLEAYERVRRERASIDARLILAPSLDPRARARAVERAAAYRVPVHAADPRDGATPVLAAFEVALVASGTAALEAVLARAVPVVAYRAGLLTEVVARAFLRTPHIALPNVLLGRGAFTELLQRDVEPRQLSRALKQALDRRRVHMAACDEVEALLTRGGERTPSRRVAHMLLPWLRP